LSHKELKPDFLKYTFKFDRLPEVDMELGKKYPDLKIQPA
jgi:hypothetical protein